jgi:pre-rRNA-processing protein TSR1
MVKKTSAPLSKKHGGMEEDEKVLESDPMKRENLEMFATPDALEGEQNLVGFDEEYPDEDDEEDDGNNGHIRPAGWSDYQSSWLDGIDGDVSVGEGELDRGELAKALNQKSSQSVATGVMDMDDDDNEISPEEKALLLNQRRKDHKDTLEFPDEVEITEDLKAQDRLARYRSIKSFRKSYWDPKENLPEDYSQIYHFKSFRGTQRDVMADMKDITAAASKINGSFWGKSPETSDQQDMDDDCEDDDLLEACIPSG